MAKKDAVDGFVVLIYGKDDIKKHLHKLFDFVVVGIKDNITIAIYVKFMVSDTKYMSNQIGCHNSRIDNHDRDLREPMGHDGHHQRRSDEARKDESLQSLLGFSW